VGCQEGYDEGRVFGDVLRGKIGESSDEFGIVIFGGDLALLDFLVQDGDPGGALQDSADNRRRSVHVQSPSEFPVVPLVGILGLFRLKACRGTRISI